MRIIGAMRETPRKALTTAVMVRPTRLISELKAGDVARELPGRSASTSTLSQCHLANRRLAV